MHFNVYDIFYSPCSHQHVSAAIPAALGVMLLLQDYRNTNVVSCVIGTL
jgi:hypothetical protein